MPIDLRRSSAARRIGEFKKDFRKTFADVGADIRTLGVSIGYYDSLKEAIAEVNASRESGENGYRKCSLRNLWLQVLLGVTGKSDTGIEQILADDKYKYDSLSIENTYTDLLEQEKAIAKLKLHDGSDTGSGSSEKKLNSEEEREIKSRITEYEQSLSHVKDYKGKKYTPNSEKLKKILEDILTANKQNSEKLKKIKELKSAIRKKQEDKKNAKEIKEKYEKLVEDLEEEIESANFFLRPFGKKIEAARKTFSQKMDKIEEAVTSGEGIDEAKTDAAKASRVLLTIQDSQVANYKRITEGLIDAYIDFYRFIKEHKNTEAVNDTIKVVILNIRRENRTYFHKEVIDEMQKNTALSEKEADELIKQLKKEAGELSEGSKKGALKKTFESKGQRPARRHSI